MFLHGKNKLTPGFSKKKPIKYLVYDTVCLDAYSGLKLISGGIQLQKIKITIPRIAQDSGQNPNLKLG